MATRGANACHHAVVQADDADDAHMMKRQFWPPRGPGRSSGLRLKTRRFPLAACRSRIKRRRLSRTPT